MKKKKADPLTLVIYGVIVLFILYFAAALGTAVDLSLSDDGSIDFSKLSSSLEQSITNTDAIISHITNTSSNAFGFVLGTAFAIAVYIIMKYTSRKRLHRKGVEHGSAQWATEKEEKFLADKSDKKKNDAQSKSPYETDNNIILTQEVKMSLNTRQHRENLNVLVIGGSGAGKSRFFVKPNIMQLNTSYVITDPKGELLRSCGRLLEKAGYEIRVFNLIDMSHSNNYNPFHYVYKNGEVNETYVMKLVNCLMKNTKQEGSSGGDQFWDDSTKALTLAISFYLLERHELEKNGVEFKDPEGALDDYSMNFTTVMRVMALAEISEEDENHVSPLDIMMDELYDKNPHSMGYKYYRDFKKAPAETAKSILISAAVRFAAFELPEVADLTHTDNIHLDTLGDRKTALFVIIPSSDTTFNFLAAMMYTQLFDTLYDTANFKYGGRLPVHVRCMLDEFANVGTIPDFDKLLATMRSMEISANIIIQNLAQLKKMYDKSWEIITGNCDSLLFLGGQEASTLEAISKQLGKETIDVVSYNRTRSHRNPSTSENNSIMGRELMTPDELKIMKPKECVLIVRALHPFFCHKFDIEMHQNYKYLEDYDEKYAYLIDNLMTEKIPDNTSIDKITKSDLIDKNKEEEMTSDWDIPEDTDEKDTIDETEPDADTEAAEQLLDDEFSTSASQNFFYGDDSLEDEPPPEEFTQLDMSEQFIFNEENFPDPTDLF